MMASYFANYDFATSQINIGLGLAAPPWAQSVMLLGMMQMAESVICANHAKWTIVARSIPQDRMAGPSCSRDR
jgi:hypothetical protein